jgi:hypothetical protein
LDEGLGLGSCSEASPRKCRVPRAGRMNMTMPDQKPPEKMGSGSVVVQGSGDKQDTVLSLT